jgi:hypothetical protein
MSPGIILVSLSMSDARENHERPEQDFEVTGQALQSNVLLSCTFDFRVTVSVKIEHPVVFHVIILHSEQSNTTAHVHFIIATCCDLTLGRH